MSTPDGAWGAATRALLEETDLPVETVANRVGLSSAVNLRQPLPRGPAHHARRLPARLPRGQARTGSARDQDGYPAPR
ncbi:hypothetical protein [Streptomyces niveus]|uniref:hypothetical protein n=1 Tax=Streptomyces niveus TaxID=193462 RepID=UPI0036D31D64